MVSDLRLCNGAHGIVALAFGAWVVRWQDSRGGTDNGADVIVHLPGLGLVDHLACQHRARRRIASGVALGDGHVRVLVQVVVVVGRGAYDGARLSRAREVNIGVRGGQGGVGCADDGAVSGC